MIRYVCDACGTNQDAERGIKGEMLKPRWWTIRCDDYGERHVCSEKCIAWLKEKDAAHNRFGKEVFCEQ